MAIIDWAKEGASITDTSGLFDSLGSVLDVQPTTGKASSVEDDESSKITTLFLNAATGSILKSLKGNDVEPAIVFVLAEKTELFLKEIKEKENKKEKIDANYFRNMYGYLNYFIGDWDSLYKMSEVVLFWRTIFSLRRRVN